MIPALARRGFGHGSGVVSPDGSVFVLNIPKNASSYVLDWSRRLGWQVADAESVPMVKQMIVLLRDPIERWISGIAQYINTYILSPYGPNGPVFPGELVTHWDYAMDAEQFITQYTDITERLIFDNAARFDDHVWPQSEIVKDVLPGITRHWFRVDQNLNQNLAQHLGWQHIEGLDRNSGNSNINTHRLQQFFRERLRQRPELISRLQRHYQQDLDLIEATLP